MNTATNSAANPLPFLVVRRGCRCAFERYCTCSCASAVDGTRPFRVLADAIRCAETSPVPCDVHAPAGNTVWVWDMRPESHLPW